MTAASTAPNPAGDTTMPTVMASIAVVSSKPHQNDSGPRRNSRTSNSESRAASTARPTPTITPSARSHEKFGSASCSTVIATSNQPTIRSAVPAPCHAV